MAEVGEAKVVSANVLRKRVQRAAKKADRLERVGRYEEAEVAHREHEAAVAELLEVRRKERVARRRARVVRNAEIYAGDLEITHPDDVAYMFRLAIEIDRAYHPAAWVKDKPRE